MPYALSNGVQLYYEEAGQGTPIVFVHEFAGDLWSWEGQMQHFGRHHRCIAYNACGYPPSDVPTALTRYSQKAAVDDIAAVIRHIGLGRAHVIGCSMGAQATLQFGMAYPRMARSLTLIGTGTGSDPQRREQFLQDTEANARLFEEEGLAPMLRKTRAAPNRARLKEKNPRAYDDFCRRFMNHSPEGRARTLRGLQARRPSIYSLERQLRALKVPTHVIVGDEDANALEPSLFIRRVCPAARLTVVAGTGHLVNTEEPDLFNTITDDFLTLVDDGRWKIRS